MRIVLDSNIFFSALIKDSILRKIILEYNDYFLFPSFIFQEIKEHKEELIEKTGLEKAEFRTLIKLILKKIKIVPTEVLNEFKDEALEIVKDIDKDDVIFIACALAYENSLIWSEDKKLKKQNKVEVYNTKEIMELIDFKI